MISGITFIKGQGASKRTAAGEDFISGLIFYTATLPSGFTTTANIKILYSIIDAVNAGILNDFSDATAATGSYLVTAAGTNGDTITLTSADLNIVGGAKQITTIGTYTKVAGDTTTANVATSIGAAINALTNFTGYSATVSGSTVTIIAPKSMGIYLNSGTPLVATLSASATLAGTLTQFSGGVASLLAVYYYHINRFFQLNPNSQLYVGFFPVPSTYTFSEITLMQNFSGGIIRQVAIYKNGGSYSSVDLTAIDTQIKTYNDANNQPLSALYAGNLQGTTITNIADLSSLTANKASSIIGQDGAGLGNFLFLTCGKSITQLGAALGLLSLSAVSEDIAEPAKFNLNVDGYEDAVPAFANGLLLTDATLSRSAINSIDAKRHIFGLTYTGVAGTFFNDNHCAVSTTSDYAYINDNRTIDKAIRGVYAALIPYLKSRLIKNADGTLASTTISFLQNTALQPLYQMSRDGDLGEVSQSDVYIDPSQNVTSTNTIVINVYLNEDAIARQIQVPISFK